MNELYILLRSGFIQQKNILAYIANRQKFANSNRTKAFQTAVQEATKYQQNPQVSLAIN